MIETTTSVAVTMMMLFDRNVFSLFTGVILLDISLTLIEIYPDMGIRETLMVYEKATVHAN